MLWKTSQLGHMNAKTLITYTWNAEWQKCMCEYFGQDLLFFSYNQTHPPETKLKHSKFIAATKYSAVLL